MEVGSKDQLYIGLTGGIASGKSTVSQRLRERGVVVIDADQLARELVAPGSPTLAAIAERFAPHPLLLEDGSLDRAKLGAMVFEQPTARAELEAIIHPAIDGLRRQRQAQAYAQGAQIVCYDAALIIEKGLDREMDGLIVVSLPEPLQLARLRQRDGLDEAQAQARLAAQTCDDLRRQRATWIIDNSGSREATVAQVDQLVDAWASTHRLGPSRR